MYRKRERVDSTAQAPQFSADVLIESLPDAVVIADGATGKILTVNDAAEELFDCPAAELTGRNQLELHPSEDAELYREAFTRGAGGERVDRLQDGSPVYIQTPTGKRKPVEINAQRVEQDGQTVVVGVFREITAQLERKQQLEQTTTRLDTLLDSAPLPVAVLDTDGCVELWNQAAEETFGYSTDEMIGKSYPLFVDTDTFEDMFEQVLSGQTIEGAQVSLRACDGSRIATEIYASPLYEDGRVTGVIGSGVDIREKKRREQHLDVVHRLLRHNLRNKLSIIQSYGRLLADGDIPDHSDVQQTGERIVTAAEELSNLSDHATRTEDEITSDKVVPCDVTTLIDSINSVIPDSVAVTVTNSHDGTIGEITTPEQANRAVSRLLTHIVEYTDHAGLQFTVELCPQYVLIQVTNQTPLLPAGGATLITDGTETALEHGQTVEVARAYLTLASVGGDVLAEGDPSARDSFRIELPRVDNRDD